MVKLNGGNSAVVCDVCRKIIPGRHNLSHIVDICEDCTKQLAVIDNFNLVEQLFDFTLPQDFYYIEIIQFVEDNPIPVNKFIKSYCCNNYSQLLQLKDEIIKFSREFNARVVFYPNARNFKEIGIGMGIKILRDSEYQVNTLFDYVSENTPKEDVILKYNVSVESKNPEVINTVCKLINKSSSEPNSFTLIPTVHGFQILCEEFNVSLFNQLRVLEHIDKVNINSDCPILLYYFPR